MRIRMLGSLVNARGAFARGDVVDWPDYDARPLIDAGHRVLYMRTSELVQRLQAARKNLQLPQALTKLDRYDLLILDDLSYVRKDQAETSVLFELIAERYERRSILITANQPFSGWDNVFPDHGMTVAAIDRLKKDRHI